MPSHYLSQCWNIVNYENWPRYSLRAVPDSSTNHDSADRISGQFLFYNFIKSKGNLRFRRLASLCVPIGVCVTTHGDGIASDVTINSLRTPSAMANIDFHPNVAQPCNLQVMICRWMNDFMKICTSDAMNLEETSIYKFKGHENFEVMSFYFGHVALVVTTRMNRSVR